MYLAGYQVSHHVADWFAVSVKPVFAGVGVVCIVNLGFTPACLHAQQTA